MPADACFRSIPTMPVDVLDGRRIFTSPGKLCYAATHRL